MATRAAASVAHEHDAATHRTHREVVNRLRRATGHLQTITGMIESGRDCGEIAQQMHAVIRALEAAKTTLIHDHMEHCLETAIGPTSREQRVAIDDFRKISRYL
ncbi:MAG: metal-sensing transcriptional repressor [Gammaproteobacteria bacterium]|nr:metal-sensing transcriptional repressor [Gammaproteobacteria bacterium]